MSKAEGYPFIGEPTGIKVIIVGAGLGGLACAIECRRKGHDVIVFENAPEIMRIGDTLVHPSPLNAPQQPLLCNVDVVGHRSECGEIDLSMGNSPSY
jgi:ribulose 1,5-bisphosphate synthetase/thiazole synthase